MKRVIICILTVTLLIGALAVPTYAADFDNDFDLQVLDYATANGGTSNSFSFTGSRTVTYQLPDYFNFRYVDLLFVITSGVPTVSISGGSSSASNNLTVVKVGQYLYRAYGYVPNNFFNRLHLHFTSTSTASTTVVVKSFKVYSRDSITPDIRVEASGFYTDGDIDLSLNWGDSRPTRIFFTPTGEFYDNQFVVDFFCEDWRLYDFVDIQVSLSVNAINSISANFNGQNIPFTVSEVLSDSGFVSLYYLTLRLDLRGLNRREDGNPLITVSGIADFDHVNAISLHDATGYVEIEFDALSYFFNKLFASLISNFDSLSTLVSGFRSDVNTVVTTWSDIINKSIVSFESSIVSTVTSWSDTINKSVGSVGSKIDNWGQKIYDAIVGQKSDDTTVSDAIENQEQVNQEVNTQLQSAVGSWSDNVGEVTQGFNLALTNATPALIWISGMAQNIFSGMGWFGNIFFFLGFLHVFFLLMSKSGLGRAIDRADKRGDD